jgi:hypothetical protein
VIKTLRIVDVDGRIVRLADKTYLRSSSGITPTRPPPCGAICAQVKAGTRWPIWSVKWKSFVFSDVMRSTMIKEVLGFSTDKQMAKINWVDLRH